jgi:hypothetical protein
MKRLLHLIISLLSLTILANGKCFTKEEQPEPWKDRKDAASVIKSICNQLKGDYRLNDRKGACVDGPRGQSYEFSLQMDQDPNNRGTYRLEHVWFF